MGAEIRAVDVTFFYKGMKDNDIIVELDVVKEKDESLVPVGSGQSNFELTAKPIANGWSRWTESPDKATEVLCL